MFWLQKEPINSLLWVRTHVYLSFGPTALTVWYFFVVFRLRKEPINSLSFMRLCVHMCVRLCVCTCVRSGHTALTVQYFFLIFCLKLGLHDPLTTIRKFFGQKNGPDYRGLVSKIRQNQLFFCHIFKTLLQILMKLGQKLEDMVCHHMK